ncbi:MAG TPA: hypothetical protein VMV51_00475 [Gemmatimonadaceae bacterium]|nr:hypothetical protein [Gemmatimonadaceae bacterium]
MSLNGIGGLPPDVLGGSTLTRGVGGADRAPANVERSTPGIGSAALPAAAPRSTAAGIAAVPADAPEGTDPELWKILTSEERQHFATAGARGPLTYGYLGRSQSPSQPAVSRGARLDLRA